MVSELRKNQSGAEVQAQVIYVGLAQAYFVDPSGEFAGVGSPGEDGWKWSIKPELADENPAGHRYLSGRQTSCVCGATLLNSIR